MMKMMKEWREKIGKQRKIGEVIVGEELVRLGLDKGKVRRRGELDKQKRLRRTKEVIRVKSRRQVD